MKYEVKFTSRFKKDLKSIQKPNSTMKRFWDAIEMLANGMPLPDEFDDHKLVGNFIVTHGLSQQVVLSRRSGFRPFSCPSPV